VPRLDARTRAKLPDSAFAYVDSQGKRHLPINDAAHVRNALARFNQVLFEDEAARDRARLRLLRAAKKHSVVPIGFISAQLHPERRLPKGQVTFLLTDIEGSTDLLTRLDAEYVPLVSSVRRIMRAAISRSGGQEIDARGDEFFAVFERATGALDAAIAIQRALGARSWPHGMDVRVRMGMHSGRPTLTETGYAGLAVHATARICQCAHGGQIVVSSAARAAVREPLDDGVTLRSLGAVRFKGLRDPVELSQVEAAELLVNFPPLRTGEPVQADARSSARHGESRVPS
jgi:class 3 adenylate cyclase